MSGIVLDDALGIIRVPVQLLRYHADPIATNPWSGMPLTVDEIRSYMEDPFEHPEQGECMPSKMLQYLGCNTCEIIRIAHFVRTGWPATGDDAQPITVDVGIGDYFPKWMITDGNHRVAAAIVRGDEWVDVSVSGSWERAVAMLVEGLDGDDTY